MSEQFDKFERLYRAVYPPNIMPVFWKENGELSSAVFKDKNGLSVERAGGRDENAVVDNMLLYFYGYIITVHYGDCDACHAVVKYLPTNRSKYHSEIHGSNSVKLLSQPQCKHLARVAHIIGHY